MKEEQAAAAFEDVFYKTTFDEVSPSTTHIFYLSGMAANVLTSAAYFTNKQQRADYPTV